ncbi:MAG: hypothetical protein AB8E82_01795 [Aureispira sp.]
MKSSIVQLIGVLMLLASSLLAQKTDNNSPQKVHSIVKVQYEYEWYVQQHNLWKIALEKEPKNPDGWLSYYTTTRMAKILSPDADKRKEWAKAAADIVEAMKSPIKDSYEYHFIQGYHQVDHFKQMEHIFKAYEMDPERPDTYDDLLTYYEVTRDFKKLQEVAVMWKASGDFSPTILLWNYNMLVSTAPNSILLTYGDNDTYSAWVLQHAEGVRTDVQVLNVNLLLLKKYRDLLFKELNIPLLEDPKTAKEVIAHLIKHRGERPLYMSLAAPYKRLDIADKLYNVGVALRYAETEPHTLSYLVDNYENNLLLDHLKCSAYAELDVNPQQWFKKLYIPSFMVLHKHYALTNNQQKQAEVKALILKITAKWPERSDIIAKLDQDDKKVTEE